MLSCAAKKRMKKRESAKLKKHRATKFVTFLYEHMDILKNDNKDNNKINVLDVAGGKGDICWELLMHRDNINTCYVIDPCGVQLNQSRTKRVFSKAWHLMKTPDVKELTVLNENIKNNNVLYNEYNQMKSLNWLHKKEVIRAGLAIVMKSCELLESLGFGQYQTEFNKLFITQELNGNSTFTSMPSTKNVCNECNLILGMHPDQPTEDIVRFALRKNISFAIVPCCVYPSLFPDRTLKSGQNVITLDEFIEYLCELDDGIQKGTIDLPSCNTVLYKNVNI